MMMRPLQRVRFFPWMMLLINCNTAVGDGGDKDTGFGGSAPVDAWSIDFTVVAKGKEMHCGVPSADVGTNHSNVQLRAFAFYVHNPVLVHATGTRETLELIADDSFQSNNVALLDFDDGTARCLTETSETHTSLLVRRPVHDDDIVAFEFTLGVPPELNHIDLSGATSPLNQPLLYWSWQGGYKYFRLEVESTNTPQPYLIHLGSTECEGTPAQGFHCGSDNLAHILLTGDPRQGVLVDLGALFSDLNVDIVPDGVSDAVAGCMSSLTDPECVTTYAAFGLPFAGQSAATSEQRVFRLP